MLMYIHKNNHIQWQPGTLREHPFPLSLVQIYRCKNLADWPHLGTTLYLRVKESSEKQFNGLVRICVIKHSCLYLSSDGKLITGEQSLSIIWPST